MKAKIDYAFLGLLGLLLALLINQSVKFDYSLSLFNYLALIAWALTLAVRITKPALGRILVAWLIILATFNLFNFDTARSTFTVGFHGEKSDYTTPLMNPIMFLLLVIFYIINRKSVNRKLARFFKGSPEELSAKQQKMVQFYLDRFGNLPPEEFEVIYANIHSYPDEAQEALMQLKSREIAK